MRSIRFPDRLPASWSGSTATRRTTARRRRIPWRIPLSSGTPNYNFYSLEVVQRMGYDSFTPDNGVLLAKNKDQASSVGGPNAFSVFNWVIDAHPEDIRMLDFKRPDGTPVMRTIADYRQLNDALFHAGLNSGSAFEWTDGPNRLQFYVIDVQRDPRGVLVVHPRGALARWAGIADAWSIALEPNRRTGQAGCDWLGRVHVEEHRRRACTARGRRRCSHARVSRRSGVGRLSPLSHDHRRGLGGRADQCTGGCESRRLAAGAGLRQSRRKERGVGHTYADGDLRERPDEDGDRHVRSEIAVHHARRHLNRARSPGRQERASQGHQDAEAKGKRPAERQDHARGGG